MSTDPYSRFDSWYRDACDKELNDPNAMALATVDHAGCPSVRMVLLKGFDDRGFVFYTNLGSRKAQEISENSKVSLLFHWKSLKRQIRIVGEAEQVDNDEADTYFASRPKTSQIGAWASIQSQPLASRFAFEQRIAEFTAKYALGEVPRPAFWSGFRVIPSSFEFWEDRPFRLHDRVVYNQHETGWTDQRLFP